MAESLRRLVNISTFSVLQEKLEKWFDDYKLNTTDQNVARGCEVIELNAKVQGQLFRILHQCAAEGGTYGGASIIKSRLLPWLSQGLLHTGGVTDDKLISDCVAKDKEMNEIQDMYETSIQQLETDLRVTQDEANVLKAELDDTKCELDRAKSSSTSDKMFTEAEIRELKTKLDLANDENIRNRSRVNLLDDYERQVRVLREEVAVLSGRRSALRHIPPPPPPAILVNGSEAPLDEVTPRALSRVGSPLSSEDPTQRYRQQNLISRFNDMYSINRINAMETLRTYSQDHENNQKIVFAALTEAFNAAKMGFRQHKMKVRSSLALTHLGPSTLEEAVQSHINRHPDSYDLAELISAVIRNLNHNPRIYLPVDASYSLIRPFISEACQISWGMSALAHPLDVAITSEAELFDDTKYRRSYDSEFTAPLVDHHVWPALVQAGHTIVKGEAVTRRGASLHTSRSRSKSPVRSLSPSRAAATLARVRARSRSPSPRRAVSPINLSTNGGRSTPTGARSTRSSLRTF
ncbi:mitochondria-eating protein-like [Tubulanus polymorphus]|uniref:mitochondria-eating protein-like n=1 Tax=Tubulanus polymorphus TaxID=672921 RepID=UPI003DA33D94